VTLEEEVYLKYVVLSDDNRAILLNGKRKYKVPLPKNFFRKRSRERLQIVGDLIFSGCKKYSMFYVTESNVSFLAKEVVSLSFERSNADDVEEQEADDGGAGTARAKKALELAIENSQELFLNEFGRAFAAMKVNGHVEVHPMDEHRFKNWISGIYYEQNDDLLSEEDLKKIVRILTARAEFDSNVPRHRLDVRVRGYSNSREEKGYDADAAGDGSGNRGYYTVGNVEAIEDFDAIYYDLTNPNGKLSGLQQKVGR
jgi:hypothetical protein